MVKKKLSGKIIVAIITAISAIIVAVITLFNNNDNTLSKNTENTIMGVYNDNSNTIIQNNTTFHNKEVGKEEQPIKRDTLNISMFDYVRLKFPKLLDPLNWNDLSFEPDYSFFVRGDSTNRGQWKLDSSKGELTMFFIKEPELVYVFRNVILTPKSLQFEYHYSNTPVYRIIFTKQ